MSDEEVKVRAFPCIQADRIVLIDEKIDAIDKKLDAIVDMNGPIAKISNQVQRLTGLIENGRMKSRPFDFPDKLPWIVVLTLVGILATLLGSKLPF